MRSTQISDWNLHLTLSVDIRQTTYRLQNYLCQIQIRKESLQLEYSIIHIKSNKNIPEMRSTQNL